MDKIESLNKKIKNIEKQKIYNEKFKTNIYNEMINQAIYCPFCNNKTNIYLIKRHKNKLNSAKNY